MYASGVKHRLSDHIGNNKAALECKHTLPFTLELLVTFVFREGVTVRIVGGCCTCDLPSGAVYL